MKNKTKEQLWLNYLEWLPEYAKDSYLQLQNESFEFGYDSRQPEIDALKEQMQTLTIDMEHYKNISNNNTKF